jgi:hypothetical protein
MRHTKPPVDARRYRYDRSGRKACLCTPIAMNSLQIRDFGAIAQLGERLDRTQEVGGSSPPSSTKLTKVETPRSPAWRPGSLGRVAAKPKMLKLGNGVVLAAVGKAMAAADPPMRLPKCEGPSRLLGQSVSRDSIGRCLSAGVRGTSRVSSVLLVGACPDRPRPRQHDRGRDRHERAPPGGGSRSASRHRGGRSTVEVALLVSEAKLESLGTHQHIVRLYRSGCRPATP